MPFRVTAAAWVLPWVMTLCAVLAGCGSQPQPQATTGTVDLERLAAENELLREQQETAELRRQLADAQQALRQTRPSRHRASDSAAGRPHRRRQEGRLLSAADQRSFAALERELGGSSGVAVSELGVGRPVAQAGSLSSGPAWSTIKVPMAVAALRQGAAAAAAPPAITASDNAAADRMWQALGGGQAAGRAVEQVLRDAGDTQTRVQTRKIRPAFSAFGQTDWPLDRQQRFIAGLACIPQGPEVLGLMGQVIPSQRWGLGAVGRDAQFKGGWGPDPQGRYLVRQIGVIRLAGGRRLAVSMATIPADGQMITGTRNLTRIAAWVVEHVPAAKVARQPRC